jgi:hypothetical protein
VASDDPEWGPIVKFLTELQVNFASGVTFRNIIRPVKKRWAAAPVVIAAPLVLAVAINAASGPATTVQLSGASAVAPKFAVPADVTVSAVMPTWATVRFVLPAADQAATSEEIVFFPVRGQSVSTALGATVAGSPVTLYGLQPSTSYHVEVSVNGAEGHAASAWTASSEFTTAAAATPTVATSTPASATPAPPTTPATLTPDPGATGFSSFLTPWQGFDVPTATSAATSPGALAPASGTSGTSGALTAAPWPASAGATASTSTPASTATVPYAPALSSYNVVAQTYSATDIVNGGWAQAANDTAEGAQTCPVANTSYSSALDAVVLTTGGTPHAGATTDCAHIRSQLTVPTSGDVVEAKIWLPSLSSAVTMNGTTFPAGTLLDWTSMWTDGAASTNGTENWPADTEIDAVETQYGANYVSVHYGSVAASGGSTGNWTTEPQGWEAAGTSYATPNAGAANVQAGWNVVDIEFTSTDANIYINGALFVTVPGSVLTHDPAYLDFGISGPDGSNSNYQSWPAGPATEDVQYVRVFS